LNPSSEKQKPLSRRQNNGRNNYPINSIGFFIQPSISKQKIKMILKELNKIINDETKHRQTRLSALFKKQELIIKRLAKMKKYVDK